VDKKEATEKLMRRRLDRLRWLKSCCEQVISCADQTLKKIETEGLKGNFSCNHDIQKWSERIHRTSYELWLLGDVYALVEEGKEYAEVEVEETTEEEDKNETS